jgi:hypothetical protein
MSTDRRSLLRTAVGAGAVWRRRASHRPTPTIDRFSPSRCRSYRTPARWSFIVGDWLRDRLDPTLQ